MNRIVRLALALAALLLLTFGHAHPATAATTAADGRTGAVAFGSASDPAMLVAYDKPLGIGKGYATAFRSGRIWVDPVAAAAGQPAVAQSATVGVALQRWDVGAARWDDVETKTYTLTLSTSSGSPVYGVVEPSRFAFRTSGGVTGTALTWNDYRAVVTVTWADTSTGAVLGSAVLRPSQTSDLACVQAHRCYVEGDGVESWIAAA